MLVWYLASFLLKRNQNDALPYPHDTFIKTFELLFLSQSETTWLGMAFTLYRILIGFVLSFLLGCLLGTIASLYKSFSNFLSISINIKRAIPTAAVVIVLLGIFLGPKTRWFIDYVPCILTFIVAFPIIYDSFKNGLDNEDKDIIDALRLEGNLNSPRILFGIRYKDAWPYIGLGIAQSFGLSFKVSIMSEILIANSSSKMGLGSLIINEKQNGTIENVLSYALIALLIMALIDIPFIILKRRNEKEG
ncbi:MAG TPA: hypothetical protein DD377_05355 [Firmicutes bacterium]|nr:hypothetical protein [Bacillota bacterium]